MYVVCSRPASVNGLGMTPQAAHAEIVCVRAVFEVLQETPGVYPTWENLIAKYATAGKRAHDARLVAVMLEHQVRQLLTFNDADFRQFVEVLPLHPFDVLGIPRV